MGVRAHDGADPAIEVESQRLLLTCSLGVHVDEYVLSAVQVREDGIHRPERVVESPHEYAPLNVDDHQTVASHSELQPSSPRSAGRVVYGSHDGHILGEIFQRLSLIPHVIARRERGNPEVKQVRRCFPRDAGASSNVFAVGQYNVRFERLE
jgi:hypothetical protein